MALLARVCPPSPCSCKCLGEDGVASLALVLKDLVHIERLRLRWMQILSKVLLVVSDGDRE